MNLLNDGYMKIPNVLLEDLDLNESSKVLLTRIVQQYSVAYYMAYVLDSEMTLDEQGEVFILFTDYMLSESIVHLIDGDEYLDSPLHLLHKKGIIRMVEKRWKEHSERRIYLPWWNEYDWYNIEEGGYVKKAKPIRPLDEKTAAEIMAFVDRMCGL